MGDTAPETEAVKRPASALGDATDRDQSQKKLKQAQIGESDAAVATRDRMSAALGTPSHTFDFLDAAYPPRDELKELMNEIDAGTHVLVLESNNARNAKCRADNCLVEKLPHNYYDEKIVSPYRINLQELRPSNEHWSQRTNPVRHFFHVSCIESIGIDLAQHLSLQTAIPDRCEGVVIAHYQVTFHPAIRDWVEHKGKTFDAELYSNTEYKAACEEYKCQMSRRPMLGLVNRNQTNFVEPEPEPVRPELRNFIPADEEMVERRLTEMLLDTMGGAHLLASVFPKDKATEVLEVMGRVPPHLSETAIQAKLDAIVERRKAEQAQKVQAADGKGVEEERQATDPIASKSPAHTSPESATEGASAGAPAEKAGEEAAEQD